MVTASSNTQVLSNKFNIHSSKVKRIASSALLSMKLKALILLKSADVLTIFGLSQVELDEFINLFMNREVLDLERPYIVDHLESTKQLELLRYYVRGEEYTKARLGLTANIDKSKTYDQLVQDSLIESMDLPVDVKLRCIKTLQPIVNVRTEQKPIDKIAELFKEYANKL